VELLKDTEPEVRVRAAALLARALAELFKQGSKLPAWLATRTPAPIGGAAAPSIRPRRSKSATLRELLERALTGNDSQREAARRELDRQIVPGSESFPKTAAALLTELQDSRLNQRLGSAGPAETHSATC
jgi:hypothetical protein